MKEFSNDEFQRMISDLIHDTRYINSSNRSRINAIRSHAEIIVRKLLDVGQGEKLTIGQLSSNSNATVNTKFSEIDGELRQYLMDAVDVIKILGNDASHTSRVSEFTDGELLEAEQALLRMFSVLFIEFFMSINVNLHTEPEVLSCFSLLPPIIRYYTWNYLFEHGKSNVQVLNRLCLAHIKTYSKAETREWLRRNRLLIIHTPYPTDEEKLKYALMCTSRNSNGDYYLTIPLYNFDNMYDLLMFKIDSEHTSINEGGKMYESFERAKYYYLEITSGNSNQKSVNFAKLCDLIDFVYLGVETDSLT